MRADRHAAFASLRRGAELDDAAADRYEQIAANPGREPEWADHYRRCAVEARAASAAKRAELDAIVAGGRRRRGVAA